MKRTPLKRKTPLKRGKPLRKVSQRLAPLLAEYRRLRDIFLTRNTVCEYESCNFKSRDVHHMAGRGANLLRQSTWMAVCRRHHNWIHDNPTAARLRGYLK